MAVSKLWAVRERLSQVIDYATNPEKTNSKLFTEEDYQSLKDVIAYAKDEFVDGVCILGGEPLQQDLDVIFNLVKRIKEEVDKPIHMWSGYTWEEILQDDKKVDVLLWIDTLVDGRFMLDQRDLSLAHKGSHNQREIDVQVSLKLGRVCEIC